jgi:thiamine biosynthesis lipoprotein
MPSCWFPGVVERARPLLGTLVAIRVCGMPDAQAHQAVNAAFEDIALIHDRMSFHQADSDVSRLNREALHRPVAVHPDTLEVLRWSRRLAEGSRGCFDITVAAELVDWGLLPPPAGPRRPDPEGSWRDIELLADGTIRFDRPVWIDLGGIAKGYAVDRAVERLRARGVTQCCVNAGGDLRVLGPEAERVRLRLESPGNERLPVIEVENGSVASSGGHLARHRDLDGFRGPHVHGKRRQPVGTHSFACVVADHCVVADALTKVVLAQGTRSAGLLRHYGATAHLHSARHGWRTFGTHA